MMPFRAISIAAVGVAAVMLGWNATACAQPPLPRVTYQFTGTITESSDNLGWFQGLLPVGTPIEGTYSFRPPGIKQTVVNAIGYAAYTFAAGGPGGRDAQVTIGGDAIVFDATPPVAPAYEIRVVNDASGFNPAGVPDGADGYRLRTMMEFPSFFRDFTGDPVADPDSFFFPQVELSLRLSDSSGTALGSNDLPLSLPAVQAFDTRGGTLRIFDVNGEPDYAVARFALTSIAVIPEPASVVVLLSGCGLLLVGFARRLKQRDGLENRPTA